jgi:hypothetical protein
MCLLCAPEGKLAAHTSISHLQNSDSLPEMIRRIKPAVVSIETFDAKGQKLGRGTGFFIEPTTIVTNEHVIERASRADIRTPDGHVYSVLGLLAVGGRTDLVLLRIDISRSQITPLRITSRVPAEGERVFVIGNPRGLEWSVSDGIVASIRDDEDNGKLIQITAPISPGSSGSPVLDSNGQVIGVAALALSNGQNLNFAIPSDQVSGLPRIDLKTLAEYCNETQTRRRRLSEEMRLQGAEIEQKAIGIEGSKAALPYLEKAVEIDPEYGNAWWYLGDALEVLGRYPEAIDAYKRTIRVSDETHRVSKSIDDLNELFMGHLGLAQVYLKTQNPLAATDEYKILRALLDLVPSAIPSPNRQDKQLTYDLLLHFTNGLKADIEKYYKNR